MADDAMLASEHSERRGVRAKWRGSLCYKQAGYETSEQLNVEPAQHFELLSSWIPEGWPPV
jgi:hypothetical protein